MDARALTLENLVTDRSALANSFKTVAQTASAADAKLLIDQTPDCLDVLVTTDGTPTAARALKPNLRYKRTFTQSPVAQHETLNTFKEMARTRLATSYC